MASNWEYIVNTLEQIEIIRLSDPVVAKNMRDGLFASLVDVTEERVYHLSFEGERMDVILESDGDILLSGGPEYVGGEFEGFIKEFIGYL